MRWLAALMLLWAVDANAIIIIGGSGAAPDPPPADTCETQSVDAQNDTHDTYSSWQTVDERGQSWTSGVTGKLYSVSIYRTADSGGTRTITLRVGSSNDLSSSYTEFTCSATQAIGYKECVIPEANRPTLAASSVYYWLMRIDSTGFALGRDATDPAYAGGEARYDTNQNWIGTGLTTDLRFKVTVCD